MGTIADLKTAWDMLTGHSARLKALEEQVAALTARLDGPAPPDQCEHCGERALRLEHAIPHMQARPPTVVQRWTCAACRKGTQRLVKA